MLKSRDLQGDYVKMFTALIVLGLAHLSCLLATVTNEPEPKIDVHFLHTLEDPVYCNNNKMHFVGYHPVAQKSFFVKSHKAEDAQAKLELEALTTLCHINYVPNVYGAVDFNSCYYLVLEHVKSFNLGKLFKPDFHQLVNIHAEFYLSQIVQALELVNSASLLYLDLRAENVLIDHDGLVILADFGGCATPEEVAKNEFSCFCTPYYGSPEVFTEYHTESIRSCASEWWSLGVLSYIFIKGKYPFSAKNVQDLIFLVDNTSPDTRGLNPNEVILINGLLQKKIKHRLGYHSGIDCLKALDYFAGTDWNKVRTRDLVAPLKFDESHYTH